MIEKNEITQPEVEEEFTEEELALEFDASQVPDAIWEWDGQAWVPMALH